MEAGLHAGLAAAGPAIKAGRPFEHAMETERHLSDLRQLTCGGENAEAYWSPDGRKLIFQATPRGARCDQEYVLDLESGDVEMVSTGKGRTTCGYFDYPEGKRILFSSTHAARDSCPPPPDRSHGYVWAIYDPYDIYEARPDGSGLTPVRSLDSRQARGRAGTEHLGTGIRRLPPHEPRRQMARVAYRADPGSHETNLFIACWVE